MERKIRYKVVTPQRKSCQIAEGAYRLHYPKGATVRAPNHSLGVFVFDTYNHAYAFARSGDKVLEVETIGKAKKRKYGISNSLLGQLYSFRGGWRQYLRLLKTSKMGLPTGTLLYQAVKVLD